jgi:hypothetical protein
MKKVLIIVLISTALFYAGAVAIPIDPADQRPGTRLSGIVVEEPHPDWSFIQDRQEVLIQTSTWYLIPHSVTTTSFVVENDFYIPCGWCETKHWPKNVAADPSITLKVGDNLYPRTAVKIGQDSEKRRIMSIPAGEPTPDFELYRLDPPVISS